MAEQMVDQRAPKKADWRVEELVPWLAALLAQVLAGEWADLMEQRRVESMVGKWAPLKVVRKVRLMAEKKDVKQVE